MIQTAPFWLILLGSLVVFWALPARLRAGTLALISFGYLSTLDPGSTLAVLAWSLIFFFLAPRATQPGRWQKRAVPILILAITSFLAIFKYVPPLLHALSGSSDTLELLIPLGISFYTFKLIHYAIEVGRGNIQAHSLQQFLCYMFLFPIFTAGPIERFDHFLAHQSTRLTRSDVAEGGTRIVGGLIKKFFVGEMVVRPLMRGVSTDELLLMLDGQPSYKIWGYLFLTHLYVYMDFSAYSDIAIGSSRLFGIRILENFNWPVVAPNIGNFWKRWHMTLAGWCQAYVYMPMVGLTRNPYLAVFATFLIMGLWHAGSLNWIAWGLWHGAGVSTYLTWVRFKRKRPKLRALESRFLYRAACIGLTLAFVSAGYAFTLTYHHGGIWAAFRILAKLVGVDVAA